MNEENMKRIIEMELIFELLQENIDNKNEIIFP